MMSRMERKMKMKMENDINAGQDQSYLKCVFVFHEIYDMGSNTILDTFSRNFKDYNYIA
jgi:hypothetical protein